MRNPCLFNDRMVTVPAGTATRRVRLIGAARDFAVVIPFINTRKGAR